MRPLANISYLCRALLGVILACGLLLLPPSSVHAQSGMHDSAQALHHSDDHEAAAPAAQQDVAQSEHLDLSEELGGEPCCGGICLTAALNASQNSRISDLRSVEFIRVSRSVVSGQPSRQLRPPRV